VDHLLKITESKDIPELVDEKLKKNLSVSKRDGSPLYLEPKDLVSFPVVKNARVGLHMNKTGEKAKEQKSFVFKGYRYLTQPTKVSKGKHYMTIALYHQGKTESEIVTMIGSKKDSVSKWVRLYNKGKEDKKSLEGKKLTDDEICTAYGAVMNGANK
jgi:hypothetical protein